MSTGDLTNNLRKLQKQLKLIKYEEPVDLDGLSKGVPSSFLPIFHYAFTMYSPALVQKIVEMDVELFGKSDRKFMEGVYRVLRDMFGYKPPITKDQFFSSSFSERKVIMCTEVLGQIYKKHSSLGSQRDARSSSFAIRSSFGSVNSSRTGKVAFQKRQSAGFEVERGDVSGPGGHVDRKVASRNPPRPKSAPAVGGSSRATHKPPAHKPAQQTPSREVSHEPVAVPKTPGILKASSSAVQVVYVPRATVNPLCHPDDTNPAPLDVMAMSQVNQIDPAEFTASTPDNGSLAQLCSQTNKLHRSLELVSERLEKLEQISLSSRSNRDVPAIPQLADKITSDNQGDDDIVAAPVKGDDRISSGDDERIVALTADISCKIETLMARLLLVENRVTIIESRLEACVISSGHIDQIPGETTTPLIP